MLPNVSGFQWSPGHVIFLGAFFTVLLVVISTVVIALWRATTDFRARRAEKILWLSDFHDLPIKDRACRHQFTGEMRNRVCDKGFDCRECQTHAQLVAKHPTEPAADEEPFGLAYPADRLYHRGHSWVRCEPDGTATVGLDEFAKRVLGRPDKTTLPAPGTRLEANAPAWTFRRNNVDLRILSPIDAVVLEAGDPDEDGYLLKVQPAHPPGQNLHLLRGAEVAPWLRRELERVQVLLSPTAAGPSLADGGVLVHDLPAECPQGDWDAVWSRVFLQP